MNDLPNLQILAPEGIRADGAVRPGAVCAGVASDVSPAAAHLPEADAGINSSLRSTRQVARLTVEIPIKTVSLTNMREHFRITAKRKKLHRSTTAMVLRSVGKPPALPVTVTLTRISPGMLDAHDNLPSSQKNCVDQIAEWLGVDDADPRVTWKYAQERCKAGRFGVRVEFV